LDQLQVDVPFEHRQKYVQFVAIFHLLSCGRPMTNYEDLRYLFQLLKVKSVSKKHWFNTSGWGMVEVMHVVLLEVTKATFVVAPSIVVNVDEVTTIDNTQWLLIHLYVVKKWRCIPILFCVEAVSLFATSDNIFSLMVKCMLNFGGLRVEELVGKLVSIGCDKSSVSKAIG
jgi:hypothetical protein